MISLSILIVFTALVWSRLKTYSGKEIRRSLLEAGLLMGVTSIGGLELLGWLHRIRPEWIALLWALAGIVAFIYLWKEVRKPSPERSQVGIRIRGFSFRQMTENWRPLELIVLSLALGITAIVAVRSPPTNFDSMTYQLPRVMHWLQQGTLEHYPTSNVRQLAFGPGASYWQVQLFSIFDGDLAANLPQWAALVGCAIALTLWIQRFFDQKATGFAAIIGLTLPMTLLQACSTQTDLQVGCWMLVAAVYLSETRRTGFLPDIFAGLAIGLAVLTKPSAALCVAPLAIVAGWRIFGREGLFAVFRRSLIWVTVSLALCMPHFVRNVRWFGRPLGDDFGTVVESIFPALIAANSARWVALNVPSMNFWEGVARALNRAGIDANLASITFSESHFSPASPFVVYRLLLPDEDFAAYTGAFLLIGLLGLMARATNSKSVVNESRSKVQSVHPWLGALVAVLVLHFTVLKWQFWGNRLLLPLALLTLPLLGALTQAWRHRRLRMVSAALLLLQTVFVLFFSINRPLIPLPPSWNYTGTTSLFSESRTEHFYKGYNAEAVPVCQQLLSLVKQKPMTRVGLRLDENYPEYVLWRAMADAGFKKVEFYHINAVFPKSSPLRATWPPQVDVAVNISQPKR